MAGMISRAVAAEGVLAFQDRQNPEVFEYFPTSVPGILGDTLESFSCQYYGIGAKPQWVQTGSGRYESVVGGLVQGRARFDASRAQLEALGDEIRRVCHLADPVLQPILLRSSSVQPVFAGGVVDPERGSLYQFPDKISVGEGFDFLVDSGNSLFPQLVASLHQPPGAEEPSALGMVLLGELWLEGAPFVARIRTDLRQIWELVRACSSLGACSGWLDLGSQLKPIARELYDRKILQVEILEGQDASELELQILTAARVAFQALDDRIVTGPGLFRFEPPRSSGEAARTPGDGAPTVLAPWSLAINLSFPADCFPEPMLFDEQVRLQGTYILEARSYMDLGIACSGPTRKMFYDATLGRRECITPKKLRDFQKRISREVAAKNRKLEEYEQALIDGRIDLRTYQTLVAMLNNRSLTEHHPEDRRGAEGRLLEIEAHARERAGVGH